MLMIVSNYKGYEILLLDGEYCIWVDGEYLRFSSEPEAMEYIDEEAEL